jgi:dihydrofolate reductase
MRKVFVQTFMTLDGVMQAPGAPDEDRDGGFDQGGWSVNYWDEMMGAVMGAEMGVANDLLLGRRTYDIFAAHWPVADDPVVTPKFNKATKYVLTHRPETAVWENTVTIGRDPAAEIAAIKSGDGPDLSVSGSASLVQLLLTHGLVDKFQLWVFPLVLGRGKRLFGPGTVPAWLTLEKSRSSSTGVLILDYAKAEPVAAGSFALDQ